MGFRSKSYRALSEKVNPEKRYSIGEAFELVKATKHAKFDESVDVAIRLGVDAKQTDQAVRGAVSLPHGLGKKIRVLVFAKGEKQMAAKEAGADFVGDDDLITKIEKENWLDFDVVVSTPDMMKNVSRVAKILGPRGLMPNPKLGTVTFEVAQAVKEAKSGKIEFRTEKAGIVHASVGRASFEAAKLQENFTTLMEALVRAKPASAKGNYVRSLSLSTTMGPSIKLDPSEVNKAAK